jgi:hypothetical protein
MPMKIYMFHKRENAARAAAFIEADIKHKENPSSVVDLLPISRLKDFPQKSQSYIIFLQIRAKKTICARQHPDRVHKMLRNLYTWFERVKTERKSIDDPPYSRF